MNPWECQAVLGACVRDSRAIESDEIQSPNLLGES